MNEYHMTRYAWMTKTGLLNFIKLCAEEEDGYNWTLCLKLLPRLTQQLIIKHIRQRSATNDGRLYTFNSQSEIKLERELLHRFL